MYEECARAYVCMCMCVLYLDMMTRGSEIYSLI